MELSKKYQPSYWICLFRCLLILLKKRKKYYFFQICSVPFCWFFKIRVSVRVQQPPLKLIFFIIIPSFPILQRFWCHLSVPETFLRIASGPWCHFASSQPSFFYVTASPPSCLFVESKSSCKEKVNKCNMFPYFMVVNGSKMKKNKWNWFCEIYWEFCFFPMITV